LFKKYIAFGLTEPTHGSDATSLLSTAKKTEGGYILNGKKRWIGNATFADYIIIWAKNVDEGNKIQGFIVEKGSKGLTTSKIENKYSLRIV
jgi:alkylation response protein AidB-like acyl-CoA dehydrogenase